MIVRSRNSRADNNAKIDHYRVETIYCLGLDTSYILLPSYKIRAIER